MKSAPDVDALVLHYLDTLETYQAQIQQLSKNLADGYLHLAEANFHAPPGRRYGRDYYDARMVALRGVKISERIEEEGEDIVNGGGGGGGGGVDVEFGVRTIEESGKEQNGEEEQGLTSETVTTKTLRQRKPHHQSPLGEDGTVKETTTGKRSSSKPPQEDEDEMQQSASKGNPDPVRMFGLLTPPSLRAAQSSFVSSLPSVCAVLTTLRNLSRISQSLHVYKLLPSPPSRPLPDVLPLSQLDSDSGYIHLCAAGQARGVIERFMGSAEEVWLLRIPLLRVRGGLQWEKVGDVDGEVFPHFYGDLERRHVAAMGKWVDGGVEEIRWEDEDEGTNP